MLMATSTIRRLGTLTHIAAASSSTIPTPVLVDVTAKPVTVRRARAEALLSVRSPATAFWPAAAGAEAALVATVVVAGVAAAKAVSTLVPLCHALPLDAVAVDVARPATARAGGAAVVRVTVDVATTARTGVEMEALAGASVAALTLYDMLKGALPAGAMEIARVRLLSKRGGKRDWAAHDERDGGGGGDGSGGGAPLA